MASIYAAPTMESRSISYTAIQVLWTPPAAGVLVRLVRNSYGLSADENDGAVLVEQPYTALGSYVDYTVSPDAAGSFFYYSLWNQDSSSTWWLAGYVQAIFPKNWGYGTMLQGWLPSYMAELDSVLAA